MLTTEGLRRSAMSANDTPSADTDVVAGPRAGTRRGTPVDMVVADMVVADMAGAGVIVPATTSPIRNATVAARETVTARNRRVLTRSL